MKRNQSHIMNNPYIPYNFSDSRKTCDLARIKKPIKIKSKTSMEIYSSRNEKNLF